ncbi:MAG: YHYH domain-containing protein [Candidatus Paceibacterota bacterium]
MKKIILSLIISAIIVPSISFAHPGRTDSSGGHTCRTNCADWGLSTGEYHYHRSKGVPQAQEPIKSTYGEQGTGFTTPAPEYKIPANNVITPPSIINTIPTPAPEYKIPNATTTNIIYTAPSINSTSPTKTKETPSYIPIEQRERFSDTITTPKKEIVVPTTSKQPPKRSWISSFFSWLF